VRHSVLSFVSRFGGVFKDQNLYTLLMLVALRTACRSAAPGLRSSSPQLLAARFYHERIVDHYESPRNVGSLDKTDPRVGTGLVGAPACGDVMKLQMRVGPDGVIEEAVFKVCTVRLCRRRRAASVPIFCLTAAEPLYCSGHCALRRPPPPVCHSYMHFRAAGSRVSDLRVRLRHRELVIYH
jgi:hypothetical protein